MELQGNDGDLILLVGSWDTVIVTIWMAGRKKDNQDHL